jgi:uncharacterized protein
MPSTLDIAFALLFAVGIAGAAGAYFDRRLKRRIAAGVPNARLNAYRRAAALQWALAAATVLLWWREARPWRALGLVPAMDWRFYVGLLIAGVTLGLVLRQNGAVRRAKPARLEGLAPRLESVEMIVPRTAAEYRWFMLLSVTAGVCEELLYRGFLTWLVAAYVGLVAAIVLVSIAFGLAHAYQGRKGIVKTGAVALVMSGIVVAGGWLVPAMVVHALIDVAGGVVGYAVLTRPRATS